jgi:hypothetical protein
VPFEARKHASLKELSPAARSAHQAILKAFANAGTVQTGLWGEAVLAELVERDLVVIDDRNGIRGAYPFSSVPTVHRVTVAGGSVVHAMCAVDALGMSAMLDRPVTIESTEPGTGEPVTVKVDRRDAAWDPVTAVVFAGSMGDACRPSAERTCGFINFFTTAESADAWAGRHAGVAGSVLSQTEALARGIAEFGEFMRPE